MENSITKAKLKKAGITLIALVVTVVILIILAGVTLTLVLGNQGILTRAQEAKIETRGASVEEARDLWVMDKNVGNTLNDSNSQTLEELINQLVQEGKLTEDEKDTILGNTEKGIEATGKITIGSRTIIFKSPIEVGDYINYTYDTAPDYTLTKMASGYPTSDQVIPQTVGLKWQILNIDEVSNTIDIVSETPTSTNIELFAQRGYNNGVLILNDICSKQYSNLSKGLIARSIKIEDFDNKLNDVGKAAKQAYTTFGLQYGKSKTCPNRGYYPVLYAEEIFSGVDSNPVRLTGKGVSENVYETPTSAGGKDGSNGSLTITQTYFPYSSESYYNNKLEYQLLFKGDRNTWVASRYVSWGNYNTCGFSIYAVEMVYLCLADSSSMGTGLIYNLRPVVSIDSNMINVDLGKVDGAGQLK